MIKTPATAEHSARIAGDVRGTKENPEYAELAEYTENILNHVIINEHDVTKSYEIFKIISAYSANSVYSGFFFVPRGKYYVEILIIIAPQAALQIP